MSNEHINTLQHFDDLIASGVPEDQARAHVQALNSSFDGVATKKDIAQLRWLILGIGSICAIPVLERLLHAIPK